MNPPGLMRVLDCPGIGARLTPESVLDLARCTHRTRAIWRKWLSRRSQKGFVSWQAMEKLMEEFPLPKPRIAHRYGT
jgi:hypothetical protein